MPAILLISILFGLGHQWEGAILDTTLIGVILSVSAIRTRALWWPIGFHFGWNLTSSVVNYPGINSGDGLITTLILILVLTGMFILIPHPQAKALWDHHIHPAPWPPWKHRARAGDQSSPGVPSLKDGERTGEE